MAVVNPVFSSCYLSLAQSQHHSLFHVCIVYFSYEETQAYSMQFHSEYGGL